MVDLLAVFFLFGIAAFFTILVFIFKNKMLSLTSGLCWGILSIYHFQRAYSGDSDVGQMVYGLGWVCVLFTMMCWTMPFWMIGMKKEKVVKEPEVEEDYYDRIQRNTDRIRKRRPKPRSPWNM